MDYSLAILQEKTVKIKFNVSLSYKQWRINDFLRGGENFQKFFRPFFRLTKMIF